jgi:DDE_Tnp_1-associated
MEEPASARLFASFAPVRDPRRAHARQRLFDIFVIALCAVISGAEGWEDLEEYGQAQAEWFQQFLELPHGIPSPDTLHRVLSRLKPDALPQGLMRWTEALRSMRWGVKKTWPRPLRSRAPITCWPLRRFPGKTLLC